MHCSRKDKSGQLSSDADKVTGFTEAIGDAEVTTVGIVTMEVKTRQIVVRLRRWGLDTGMSDKRRNTGNRS